MQRFGDDCHETRGMKAHCPEIHAAVLAFGNRTKELGEVLDRLESFGLCRIVVIANQVSHDTLTELSRRASASPGRYSVHTSETNLGSAGGYAKALEEAFSDNRCDIAWLLDDDNRPASEAYGALLDAYNSAENPETTVLACNRPNLPEMSALDAGIWQRPQLKGSCVGFHIFNLLKRLKKNQPLQIDQNGHVPLLWAVYGGLLVPRKVFEVCGIPNRALFLYGDDVEWTTSITHQGFSIRLVREAIVDDLSLPWNATGDGSSNLARRILNLPAQRVFFEIRNRNWLSLAQSGGKTWLYRINRFVFLGAAMCLAIRYRRLERFQLIIRAIRDAESGRLGESCPKWEA